MTISPKILTNEGITTNTDTSNITIRNKKFSGEQCTLVRKYKADKMPNILIAQRINDLYSLNISNSTISKIVNNKY